MLNLSIFLHYQVWVNDVLPYALRVRRLHHHLDGGRFDGHLLSNPVRLLSHWPRRHREHTFYWQVGTLHLVFTDGTFFTAQCAEFAIALSFFISQYEQNNLTSRCCQNNPQPLYHRPPRLVSSSSQGTLVASDCDLLDDEDDIDNDREFKL